ncbi:MAG: ABC transporter permease [Clostridia bacterium BRH_c25]|nr:MAG: ABC transporter permease [Clostridia bacterium BRH_c25]
MKKTQTPWRSLVNILLPVLLLALAIGFSYFVVQFPQDKVVERFVSYKKIMQLSRQHIYMVLVSSGLAIATSVPLGIFITRPKYKRIAPKVIDIVNIGQTIPSLAVVALFVGFLGIGARTAIFALWIYSLLPILNNTLAGILEVDPSIIESAKGMGMTPSRILARVELPLALPIIIAGIRTAITINIGSAILAAFIGAGGLGDFIIAGNNVNRWQILVLGASLPAFMAILADHLFTLLEKRISNYYTF